MPNLKPDLSIPATVWRGATKNGEFNYGKTHDENLRVGATSHLSADRHVSFVLPTVVGQRNGIPYGQDQTDKVYQRLELDPYPTAKTPFLSNNIEDIAPRTYSVNPLAGTAGELTNLSSINGTPLTFALDDMNEVNDRMHKEAFRSDPRNPLSAEFAYNAIELQNQRWSNPLEKPSFENVMRNQGLNQRLGVAFRHNARDNMTIDRHLNQLRNATRDVTAQNVLNYNDHFVGNMLPEKNNPENQHQQVEEDMESADNFDNLSEMTDDGSYEEVVYNNHIHHPIHILDHQPIDDGYFTNEPQSGASSASNGDFGIASVFPLHEMRRAHYENPMNVQAPPEAFYDAKYFDEKNDGFSDYIPSSNSSRHSRATHGSSVHFVTPDASVHSRNSSRAANIASLLNNPLSTDNISMADSSQRSKSRWHPH